MVKLVFDEPEKRLGYFGLDSCVVFIKGKGYAWNGLINITESRFPREMSYIYLDGERINVSSTPGGVTYTLSAFTYPVELDQCLGRVTNSFGLTLDEQNSIPCHIAWKSYETDADGVESTIFNFLYNVHLSFKDTFSNNTGLGSTEIVPIEFSALTLPVKAKGFLPTSKISFSTRGKSQKTFDIIEEILYGTKTTSPQMPVADDLLRILSDDYLFDIGAETSNPGLYNIVPGVSLSGSTSRGIFKIQDPAKIVETTTPGLYEVK